MKNIFKPLNEQIEVVRIKRKPLTEAELNKVSKSLIFENNIRKLNSLVNFNGNAEIESNITESIELAKQRIEKE